MFSLKLNYLTSIKVLNILVRISINKKKIYYKED
jgi:hypothetical protein